MAKKKETAVTPVPALGPAPLDFTSVIESETLSIAAKRKHVLEQLGLKGRKRKYATLEERRAASQKRREERKATRLEVFKKYGLEPKEKAPKMTKEQRKQKRSERGKAKREFYRQMARADPALAKKYGIDPKRFKL